MDIIAAMRNEHAASLAEARTLLHKTNATGEDVIRADTLMARADTLVTQISARQRLAEVARTDAPPTFTNVSRPSALISTVRNEIELIKAFCAAGDDRPMPDDIRQQWVDRHRPYTAAAGTTPSVAGGYLIAPVFLADLLTAMTSQGSIRSVADCFTTDTGAPAWIPEANDTAQSGYLLTTENQQLGNAVDISFLTGTLNAWTFVSNVLVVSNQLMQDSAFDFAKLMLTGLGLRLARAENPFFTTGTGTGQPQGVVTGAAVGLVGAAGSTTSVSYDNLLTLLHSVDPAYRPNGRWMMHDTTLRYVRDIKDTNGRPLFQAYDAPGAGTSTSGGTIFGYPVVVNQDMPQMAANARSILFGDFSSYKVRTVVDLRLTMLKDRFADSNGTGFIAYIRSDGRLCSAASPVKCYVNSAT